MKTDMNNGLEQLKSIRSFPSLVKYLRDELDWPIESDDVDDLTFEYEAEELGLDKQTAVRVKEIKQLRPLADNQPWGIFFINFEPKRLPIVALRRILRALVVKKRASANKSQLRAWQQNDLLFISAYGEADGREMTLAHFSENSEMGDLPTLKVLGWNAGNTELRLESTYHTLREKLRWPEDETAADEWRAAWSAAFKLQYRETVRTSKDLAVRLARLAEQIRGRVNEVLKVESERGELRKLYKAFQEALIHDLSEDDFADMYAQTIAYGLLSASISRQSGALVADNLSDMVPNTNPFLKELMQTFLTVGGRKGRIDFDELGINEVVELLRHTQMDEVLKDFGARNPQEDPVIHFYELFLKEYDPEKRMKRGVFYTPRPVVSFIVRSVDEILRTEFGLEDGLADTTTWGEMAMRSEPPAVAGGSNAPTLKIPEGVKPDEPFVQILDPATGTGTFLVEVIDRIFETLRAKWKREGKSEREMLELWNDYVPRHLLPRLHGFELMMAPYAIAHMKIGLKLTETKYRFLSSERARIYLTNTLEEPKDFSSYFEQMAPALAHEAQAANKVKRSTPITVVIGNPPYSRDSLNQGAWITDLIERYKATVRTEEIQLQALSDDYVKFLRVGHDLIQRADVGVLGFITNNSYFDGPLFRDLRRAFLTDFSDVRLVNLYGDSRKRSHANTNDENVFDIQAGVGITLLSRNNPHGTNAVKVWDIIGSREIKYQKLITYELPKIKWEIVHPSGKYARYIKLEVSGSIEDEWGTYLDLPTIFRGGVRAGRQLAFFGAGFTTRHDSFAVAFTDEELLRNVRIFLNPDAKEKDLFKRFSLCTTAHWSFSKARQHLTAKHARENLTAFLYRPFDWRVTSYTSLMIGEMRPEVMEHLRRPNLALTTTRRVTGRPFDNILAAKTLVEYKACSHDRNTQVFPLYLYKTKTTQKTNQLFKEGNSRRPNINEQVVNTFSARLQMSFNPNDSAELKDTFNADDIFHYIYAVLYSPSYRSRYAEFFKVDFPRIPLTSDAQLFRKLCALGADLVALHLLEDDYEAASWNRDEGGGMRDEKKSPLAHPITRFKGSGSAEVAKGHPKYADGNVAINPARYFEGVPPEVWNFHVGGYQVCQKWLKDRRERTLTDEDITHYQRVVVALNETIRLMNEIDRTIEAHGGWPLVGSQETPPQPATPDGLPFA